MKNKLQSVIYAILRVLVIFCLIAIVGGIFVAFYSFMDDPPNNTIGVIGGVMCFGGFGLSWLIAKVGGKIVDHFESLHEPEPEPESDALPEDDEPPLQDDIFEDQTVNPEAQKIFTKIGWIISAGVVIIMMIGIFYIYSGSLTSMTINGIGGSVLTGFLIFMVPPLVLLSMALLPEKMRGVKKKPRRLRAMEILVIVSTLMTVGGVLTVCGLVGFGRRDKVLYIIASSCVVLGFVGLFIFTKKYRDLAGKYTIRIEVFPSDEEFEKSAYSALNKMGVADTVLDDEQERELRRIEEQDRQAGIVHMTKEQVEEYEKHKHF
ncbi:MAG: hypothetical protein K2N56_09505 [Oscillospiraceae bacterium]|nr:hypothetical protein [Oscillospiraceae bacterium]